MKDAGRYHYVTDCVGATSEDMYEFLETTSAVPQREFAQAIGPAQWKSIQANLGYDRSFPISKDWAVNYGKGVYRGVPAYFLQHSHIEHIYTLDGREGASARENPRRRRR